MAMGDCGSWASVSRHEQAVAPDVADLAHESVRSGRSATSMSMADRIRKDNWLKACAIGVEQIAPVGSPLSRADMRRRHNIGTGGAGTRYRTRPMPLRIYASWC